MSDFSIHLTTIIFIVNLILAFTIVFLQRKDPSSSWAWILVLMFLPIIGFILYLFIGMDFRKVRVFTFEEGVETKKLFSQYKKLLKENNIKDTHPALTEDWDLIKLLEKNGNAMFTSNNKVRILKNGEEKFEVLMKSLEEAKHHIHMQYYIIRDDKLGRKIRNILVQKAKEGIQVKLLYDGMGSIRLPKSYVKPIVEAGGICTVFYPPFLPHINIRINYRNHRKITVIDGQKAFIGGFNLGDEYLGKKKKFGLWRDNHFLLEGNSVDFLQQRFFWDWEFATKTNISFHKEYFPTKDIVGNTGIQIVSSGPDSKWETIKQSYIKMIAKAKKSIYIQTAYFIPGDTLLETLRVAALGGVDVRIMIPSKPDHPFVYWASISYLSELLDSGVKAYLYRQDHFLHAKTIIIDGRIVNVGSANFDIRSFHHNFEINAVIYDKEMAAKLEEIFWKI